MAGNVERKCPRCNVISSFRADQKTCGSTYCKNLGKKELTEVNEISGDTWIVSLPKTRIHTLDQLLKYCEVDLDVWTVEKFICNKWEMGYVAESNYVSTGDKVKIGKKSSVAAVEPLFQVKAFLKKIKFDSLDAADKDNAKLRSRVEKLKLEMASERRLTKRLAQNHSGYDDLLASIKDYVNALGDLSLPKDIIKIEAPKIIPAVSTGHTEDAVILCSDTHFGDKIRYEDTSGFPEYDLPISGNRMGYVTQKQKQVLTLHRAMYPIKTLYYWVGGDIGNGILHDAPQSNQLFMPAQVHFSYHMLKFAIEDLLTLTVPDEHGNVVVENIVLLFTVGNHMRLDEKMPTKLQGQRTLDWLIYQFIIEKFKDHPKISIHQEMSPFIFENISGHRYMFAHGMQVGYKNSPDAQMKAIGSFQSLVTRLFDSPEWRKKNGLEGSTFDRACIGDIHVPIKAPRFVSNGSLNGQNELGVNWTLEPIPSGQQIFGVSKSHQETWGYFLGCGHVQKKLEDFNSYGRFAESYAERVGR